MLKVDLGVLPLVELNRLFAPIEKEAAIAIAVSGGKDSLALLLLVYAWQIQVFSEQEVHVYTLDHGLRAEGEKETQFVKSVAGELGIRTTILRWDGDKPENGIQAGARAARYRLIGEAMKKDGVGVLLTGHHRKDQAETVLMRLAHSSGLKGLGGMRPLSQLQEVMVFRPLLDMEPEFLEQVVKKSGLTPIDDPSNSNEDFERVRWRRQLPALFELGLSDTVLARFALRAQRADQALDLFARSQFDQLVSQNMFGGFQVELAALNEQPEEIAIRIIGEMVRRIAKTSGKLSQLEDLQKQLGSAHFAGKTLNGSVFVKQKGLLLGFRELVRIDKGAQKLAPGSKMIWDQRFEIDNSGTTELSVEGGGEMTRPEVEEFVGSQVKEPMSCIKGAPVVRDIDQKIVALGTLSRSSAVVVSNLQGYGQDNSADQLTLKC
ncbi:tRNA(Ile)-lysidine synthetase [hydrothermal vent metagenome]|uniref:tRNA(Ile)-lysidine synthetase n=1 Tax=hydrothermal vent metagenome TaxID=652676 RepID=A0A3B0U1B3_9ZZZZ